MKSSGPDGLEAWCVALSACFINFVMAGIGRMSSIFYVVLIETFSVDRLEASVPFSARSITRNLIGPVVGIIGQKYGVRAATLMGGVIGTISAALCFYSYSMLWITIMWGVVNGVGTALAITLPQVLLAKHFKKHKTTASGISVSGGCIGSFVFPVLVEFLIWTYGLGGTFLILAGIIMNTIPAAMILRKPSWIRKTSEKDNPLIIVNTVEGHEACVATPMSKGHGSFDSQILRFTGHSNSIVQTDRSGIDRFNSVSEVIFSREAILDRKKINIESLQANKTRLLQMMVKYYIKKNGLRENKNKIASIEEGIYWQMEVWLTNIERSLPGSISESHGGSFSTMKGESPRSESPISQTGISPNQHRLNNIREIVNRSDEVFLKVPELREDRRPNDFRILLNHLLNEDRHLIKRLFPDKQDTDLLDQIRLVSNFCDGKRDLCTFIMPTDAPRKPPRIDTFPKPSNQSNAFSTHIKTALRLHVNPLFWLIILSRSVDFLTFVPAVTIIVDFAMDKGLPVEDGKYVIAALSAGDLLGRLCLGWITDRGYISLPRYMMLVTVTQGACTATLGFLQSKIVLLVGIALFGLLQGSLFVRHPVLVTKYLHRDEQSVAMGCINFFSGCIGFSIPNYIGYFRDTIGFYNYMFYINGTICIFVGMLWSLEPIFYRHWRPGPDYG